ncbi:MAG: VCBS repeat-containing protein [Pirellulales bacterium]|nr:VCBS repeat-containing protein [Pirellulales bacterium]
MFGGRTAVSWGKRLSAAGWVLAAVALLGSCRQEAAPKKAPPPAQSADPRAADNASPPGDASRQALADFNRGAALMEQYKYVEAAEAFEKVVKLAPDWRAARFNLALAHFNLQEKSGARDHLEIAREIFQDLLKHDAEDLHARFCLGLYYQYLGTNDKALECFEAVYRSDPDDPYVAYKCAESLLAADRGEEGTRLLERVFEIDPGFISAIYRLAMQYQRTGKRDKALPLFQRFQELNEAELSAGTFTVRNVYGTTGKYYMVLGPDGLPAAASPPPPETRRVVFFPEVRTIDANVSSWKWERGSVSLPGAAAGDVDGDGDLDLCLTALSEQGGTSLWLNDGKGLFTAGQAIAEQGVSPCFGDVDNDGDLDLWLGRAEDDLFWENDGKGRFTQIASPARQSEKRFTASARLFDIDSDGDLDLLAFRWASGSLPASGDTKPAAGSAYCNNRDGTYTDFTEKLGLGFAETPVAAAVYDDFDDDRDADLVIFPANDAKPIAWVNDRVWQHHVRDAAGTGLDVRGSVGATSGDPDKDGDRDLLVFTRDGMRLYRNQRKFRFQQDETFTDSCGRFGGTGGQFADMDNDGDLDLVIADATRRDGARGPVLLVNDWPRERFIDAAELDPGNLLAALQTGGPASCIAADFTGNGRCDLLLLSAGEKPRLIENVTPGGHWIAIDLSGRRDEDKKTRSNNSAIGARVEAKSGRVFQQYVVGVPSGPVALPPLRIHAGLGDNPTVEWLRILWPDGVLQAELELAAGQVAKISEIQRKAASCPHLFAWTGAYFDFVSDFGGMGGLGYSVAPGVYTAPDPTEYVPLPQLEPLGRDYVLQVVEPLEEVVYFDEARLIAVDHPVGTEVYPHEMMAVGTPPPAFEVFCFQRPIEPVRAIDHRGKDVTDALRQVDRGYAGATDLDYRFVGFAKDHFVEIDFGDQLKDLLPQARLVLCLIGSVEYGYSSTNFAASQAGLRLKAPSIHALRSGKWVEVFHEVGYPAGVNHAMTLDVGGKILPSDRTIRITGNMEIYWDRIFLAQHLTDAALTLKEVAASGADLHFLGYPREYSPDGRVPNLYDYANIDRAAAWKLMPGEYTRFGDVAELLDQADDCYVIMGRGEEVTLRFPADAFGPVPEGCRRSFLLKTDSYTKDMDLYTACPETVEPLPFHGMSAYPYGPDEHYPDNEKTREYRRRFNTRRVLGR